MKYAKVRDVKSPCRGTKKSAGIDFFVPNYSKEFVDKLFNSSREDSSKIKDLIDLNKRFVKSVNKNGFVLESLGRVFIPSGVKVAVPEGCDFVTHNKGGVATKLGLIYGAHVVDEDYEGEIFISIFNCSPDPVSIQFGQKITQFIVRKVEYEIMEEVTQYELADLYTERDSERGDGAIGSTGTNWQLYN